MLTRRRRLQLGATSLERHGGSPGALCPEVRKHWDIRSLSLSSTLLRTASTAAAEWPARSSFCYPDIRRNQGRRGVQTAFTHIFKINMKPANINVIW